MTRRWLIAVLMSAAAGACQPSATVTATPDADSLAKQVSQLEAQNQKLAADLAERQKQIQTLQGLGGEKRLEKIYHVNAIELGRYTGGVDTDKKPGDDAIDVFISPLDQQRDKIKAAGSLTVEIYDLAQPAGENLVSRCDWNVDELAKLWKSGLMANFYRVRCPLAKDRPLKHPDLTIRVAFTDYLTGKQFTAQTTAKATLPPK
ncbi:MAG: hypothetical protein ABFD92_06000 [Planctomycetaceae bacterium]|nr:hypothetical protein [Planctomycetaceae bacterium]